MPNCRMFCEQYFSVSKTFVEQFQVLNLFFLLKLQKLCRRFLELPTLILPNVKHSLPWNSFSLRFEMQRQVYGNQNSCSSSQGDFQNSMNICVTCVTVFFYISECLYQFNATYVKQKVTKVYLQYISYISNIL